MRTRAGRLAAGLGVVLAGSVSGCWLDKPTNPLVRNPNQNIPKTNLNSPMPGNGYMGPSGGQPVGPSAIGAPISRPSGAPSNPAAVGMTSGAVAGAPAAGNPSPLSPPPGSGVGAGQPIASSGGAAAPRTIQPVASFGAGAVSTPSDLDPPPSSQNQARDKELPGVQPISTQNMDARRTWQKPSPPPIPVDPLQPRDSAPLPMPKNRIGEPLAPPPG